MATYTITGGSGTLGTALTLRLLSEGHKVRTISRNESKIESLIAAVPSGCRSRLSTLVGDVRDEKRVKRAIEGADFVIHAAAMKRIDLCAYDPHQAVGTNIDGTVAVADAVIATPTVQRASFVSSDKASAASTLYGSTKFCAERVWLASNRYCPASPKFVAVRYGNVFGSSGSVVHAFIACSKLGRLSITDARCTRFHVTISQAVQFVLDTLTAGRPGSVFVPKLPAFRVVDLAAAIAPKAEIEFVGLRPGEKIHETMVSTDESCCAVGTKGGYILDPEHPQAVTQFEYSSGNATWRLTREDLFNVVQEWLRSS